MKKYLFWLALGLAAGLILAAATFLAQPHRLGGSVIEPPQPAPEVALEDFTIAQARGKAVLVFFGYTNCPDVCPATLGMMKTLLERLGTQAGQVQMLFITVDPKRDTPEKMHAYTAAFDPRIRGLSGSETELEKVWQAYGVFREEQPPSAGGAYTVDHTSRAYLIDPQGRLRTTYTFGTSADVILADVRSLLK